MILGDENDRQLITNVVESLGDPLSVNSWTLVVPPGFGESYVPQELANRLRAHPTGLRIALVKADRIKRRADLLQQLWKQWCGNMACPTASGSWDAAELGDVLKAVEKTPKRIQVISRFHRILDWVDETILQDIRDAEQGRAIQTVVVSMYPLEWIKEQWRDKGNALLASDYGVEHTIRAVQPLPQADCFRLFRTIEGQEMPPGLIRLALGWTGGYPEHMDAVLKEWLLLGKPDWSKLESQRQLFKKATAVARRLARAVDRHGMTSCRNLIIDLHLQNDNGAARERLQRAHPWGDLLLDDSGLRSDGVGEACLDLSAEECLESNSESTPTEVWYAHCLSLYRSRQYEQVVRLTGDKAAPTDSWAVQWLRNSARIMDGIYARGVDADWRTVTSAIRDAREWLSSARVSARDKGRIGDRLRAIEELASSMSTASGLDSRRVVDVLAGLSGKSAATDHKMALTLLLLQFESARATRGHSDSILKSLSMAEQVLRVWAWWQLDLNYYDTPAGHASTWRLAGQEWRSERGSDLRASDPGDQFPGIVPFAYFAVAAFIERGDPGSGPVPAATFEELKRQMFVFDWRNDAAHAVGIFDAKNRRRFFEVVDQWLESLCACLPEGPVSRQSLLSVIDPLPTFQGDRLVWQ